MHRSALLLLALAVGVVPAAAQAPAGQAATTQSNPAAAVVAVKLTNNTLLVGHIVSETPDAVVFDAGPAGQVTLKPADIAARLDAAALSALQAPPPPPAAGPPPPVGVGVFAPKQGQVLWVKTADVGGSLASAPFKQGELDPNYPGLTGAALKLQGNQTTFQGKLSIMKAGFLRSAYLDASMMYMKIDPFGKTADMPTVSLGYSFRQRENQRIFELVRYTWYRDPVRQIKYSHQAFFGFGMQVANGKLFKMTVVPAVGLMREEKGIPKFDNRNLWGWGGFSQISVTPKPTIQLENRELFYQAFTDAAFSGITSTGAVRGMFSKHLSLQLEVTYKYDNAIAQAVTTIPAGALGPNPVPVFANNASQLLSTVGLHITF